MGKKIIFLAAVCLLAACGIMGFAYQSERSPEYALVQIAEGIAGKDYAKVSKYANLERIVTEGYDESTAILSRDVEKLNKQYPQDWFFYHDTPFMEKYIAERRSDDLQLILRTIEIGLDPEVQPISRTDGQAKWISDESLKFQQEYSAELGQVQRDGKKAVAEIIIKGNDSDYGRLAPELNMKLEMQEQEDGHWRVERVANVDEMFAPVLKGIEDYWDLQGWPVRELDKE